MPERRIPEPLCLPISSTGTKMELGRSRAVLSYPLGAASDTGAMSSRAARKPTGREQRDMAEKRSKGRKKREPAQRGTLSLYGLSIEEALRAPLKPGGLRRWDQSGSERSRRRKRVRRGKSMFSCPPRIPSQRGGIDRCPTFPANPVLPHSPLRRGCLQFDLPENGSCPGESADRSHLLALRRTEQKRE